MTALLAPVLAAEDEETDAFFLRLAFAKAHVPNPLVIVENGQEAVDYLCGVAPAAGGAARARPQLITLDLKMPRMNGFDVLAWLRSRPEFRDIPVVVMSSSSDEADIKEARSLGACDYLVKPHGLPELVEMVRALHQRWLAPKDG